MTIKKFNRDSFLTGVGCLLVCIPILYGLFGTFIFELRYAFSEREVLPYTVIDIINNKGQYHTLKLQYQEDTMSILIKDRYMHYKVGDRKSIRILRSTGEKNAKSNIMLFGYPIIFVIFLYSIFLFLSEGYVYIRKRN